MKKCRASWRLIRGACSYRIKNFTKIVYPKLIPLSLCFASWDRCSMCLTRWFVSVVFMAMPLCNYCKLNACKSLCKIFFIMEACAGGRRCCCFGLVFGSLSDRFARFCASCPWAQIVATGCYSLPRSCVAVSWCVACVAWGFVHEGSLGQDGGSASAVKAEPPFALAAKSKQNARQIIVPCKLQNHETVSSRHLFLRVSKFALRFWALGVR